MKTVFLVAGGTAGHVFPALALAEELQKRGVAVECFTDKRAEKYYLQSSLTPEVIQSSAWSNTLKGKLLATWKILSGFVHSLEMCREHSPSCVVGFGGYPSFPTVRAAQLLKIPTVLHEQNAVYGRANRSLTQHAKNVALSFNDTKSLPVEAQPKAIVTGNPVRSSFTAQISEFKAPQNAEPFHLLVFGGSQGSTIFSKVLPKAIALLDPALVARIVLHQQTRLEDVDKLTKRYGKLNVNAIIQPFFNDIVQQYQRCHLVIGRAGAGTVTELTAMGRPAILVPFAASLDGDQAQNAASIVAQNAGWMIEEKDFTPEILAAKLTEILTHPTQLEAAAKAAKALGKPQAASALADIVMRYL